MVSFEPVDGQTLPDYVFLNDSASNVVSRTVASALEARGMLAPASVRHVIVGEILELSVDTLTHQHAVATLRVSVKSAAGQLLHRKVYTANRQSLDHYPQAGDPVVSLRKPNPSTPATKAMLDQIEAEADFVVSAMAD
jgi:hypothetical protein